MDRWILGLLLCVTVCPCTNTLQAPASRGSVPGTSRRRVDGRVGLPNGSDEISYLATAVHRLGWTQAVVLSDQQTTTASLALHLEDLPVVYHVIPCNQSSSVLQLDGSILGALHSANVIIAGSPCLQRPSVSWLDVLPDEMGLMSPVVQDTRWLLAVDSHVLDTLNTSSILVNHVAFLVYHAKFHQVSFRTLTWESHGRHLAEVQSGCSRDDSCLVFPNAGQNLHGATLRVAINTWRPYIMEGKHNGVTVYRGLSIDLLDILSQALNFTYTLIMPEDGEWGDFRNGKWTGVVGQFERQEVDVSVAPMTPKPARYEVVDWCVPFTFRYTGIAVKSVGYRAADLVTALLRPFTWEVYLWLLAAFVTCACVFYLLLMLESRLLKYPLHHTPSVTLVAEYLFGSFLKEIVPSQMTHKGLRRPLVACWCIFSLFVTSFYTSKLTSLLVDVSPPPPFKSMQEMVDSGRFRWGMVGGTALLNSFRHSENPLMQQVYRGVMTFAQDDPDVLNLDAEVHRAKMAAGDYAFIGEESLLDLWAAEDCSIRVIREKVVGMETYNVFTPKNSVLTAWIDHVILRLEAAGIMDILHQRWWPGQNRCQSQDDSSQAAISVATLQGAFYAAAAGVGLAIIALVAEKLATRRCLAVWFPTFLANTINYRGEEEQ